MFTHDNKTGLTALYLCLQFEKTADHLYEAAYHGQMDDVKGE